MPQGPAHSHEKWESDSDALRFLAERGLKPNRGGVFEIPIAREITAEENSALDYLWMEWDYASQRIIAHG